LGKGAFGKVFLVTDRETKESLAVKKVYISQVRSAVSACVNMKEIMLSMKFAYLHHLTIWT